MVYRSSADSIIGSCDTSLDAEAASRQGHMGRSEQGEDLEMFAEQGLKPCVVLIYCLRHSLHFLCAGTVGLGGCRAGSRVPGAGLCNPAVRRWACSLEGQGMDRRIIRPVAGSDDPQRASGPPSRPPTNLPGTALVRGDPPRSSGSAANATGWNRNFDRSIPLRR